MKKNIVFALVLLIITGCKTKLEVINVTNSESFYKNAIVYSLPETVIKVNVHFNKTTVKHGPYFQFAEKYLGITDAEMSDYTKWEITSVDIDSVAEPDYNQYYAIVAGKKSVLNKITLTDEGFLEGINIKNTSKKQNRETDLNLIPKSASLKFTNLSIKKNVNESEDTVYKKVKHDTTFTRVPIVKKQLEKKSLNEKAEEAANFIIKNRKRRFKLIAGLNTNLADGVAINRMIDEMDKLEEEYLSLFIGKKTEDKVSYSFEYTPGKDKEINSGILFYFTEKNGIVKENTPGAIPVYIKVYKTGKTNSIDNFYSKKTEKDKVKGLYYRIPDLALVQIISDEDLIASKKMQISQLGIISTIPFYLFRDKNTVVELNPYTGNLKRISNKGTK